MLEFLSDFFLLFISTICTICTVVSRLVRMKRASSAYHSTDFSLYPFYAPILILPFYHSAPNALLNRRMVDVVHRACGGPRAAPRWLVAVSGCRDAFQSHGTWWTISTVGRFTGCPFLTRPLLPLRPLIQQKEHHVSLRPYPSSRHH